MLVNIDMIADAPIVATKGSSNAQNGAKFHEIMQSNNSSLETSGVNNTGKILPNGKDATKATSKNEEFLGEELALDEKVEELDYQLTDKDYALDVADDLTQEEGATVSEIYALLAQVCESLNANAQGSVDSEASVESANTALLATNDLDIANVADRVKTAVSLNSQDDQISPLTNVVNKINTLLEKLTTSLNEQDGKVADNPSLSNLSKLSSIISELNIFIKSPNQELTAENLKDSILSKLQVLVEDLGGSQNFDASCIDVKDKLLKLSNSISSNKEVNNLHTDTLAQNAKDQGGGLGSKGEQSSINAKANNAGLLSDKNISASTLKAQSEGIYKELNVSMVKVSANKVKGQNSAYISNDNSTKLAILGSKDLLAEQNLSAKVVKDDKLSLQDEVISLAQSLKETYKNALNSESLDNESLVTFEGEEAGLFKTNIMGEGSFLENDFKDAKNQDLANMLARNLTSTHESKNDSSDYFTGLLKVNTSLGVDSNTLLGSKDFGVFSSKLSLFANNQEANAQNIAEKVMQMSARNLREVELELTPANLGKLKIHIDMDSMQNARVSFTVSNSNAKDILSGSMNTLKESLEEAGINLAENSVSQDFKGQEDSQGYQRANDAWHSNIERNMRSNAGDWAEIISKSENLMNINAI